MSTPKEELRSAFREAEWREEIVDLEGLPDFFAGIYSGNFAICAASVSKSSSDILDGWADIQGALVALRASGRATKAKDLYLLFVVETVDESTLGRLQEILDDTRVCRKICLEKRGRSTRETLTDVPLFLTPSQVANVPSQPSGFPATPLGIPEAIQRDLELRSAQVILQRLMDGTYDID